MSDNSPTEQGTGETSGADNTALPENQNNNSADEQHDTGSGGDAHDSGQDDNSNEPQPGSTQNGSSDSSDADDEGLNRFAKSQGFDPDNLTEGERKALKLAHENQKAYRSKSQEDADALRNASTDAHAVGEEELEEYDSDDQAEMARTRSEVAQLRSEQKVNGFYLRNPEAVDFDKEMGEIVTEEAQKNGKEAARYLASDLNRLLILAKARRGDNSSESAAEAARREERELLRQRQEAGADNAAASSSSTKTTKIDKAWVQNEYDPSNAEHRKMVDEAMARGDLY